MTIDPTDIKHIVRDKTGSIETILCRGCGAVIQSMAEYDHPNLTKQRKLEDGTILRQVHVRLMPNPMYVQIMMKLSNGDRHETHCCKECLIRLTSNLDELQRLMESDITEQVVNEGLNSDVAILFKKRRVVGVE